MPQQLYILIRINIFGIYSQYLHEEIMARAAVIGSRLQAKRI